MNQAAAKAFMPSSVAGLKFALVPCLYDCLSVIFLQTCSQRWRQLRLKIKTPDFFEKRRRRERAAALSKGIRNETDH